MLLFGMDDEQPDHAHHFLHGHMRVVKERTALVHRELVNESAPRHDWILGETRHAVHIDRNFESMPMRSGGLWQVIVEDNSDSIAFLNFNHRPRYAAVIAPRRDRSAWNELTLDDLGNDVEFFY